MKACSLFLYIIFEGLVIDKIENSNRSSKETLQRQNIQRTFCRVLLNGQDLLPLTNDILYVLRVCALQKVPFPSWMVACPLTFHRLCGIISYANIRLNQGY